MPKYSVHDRFFKMRLSSTESKCGQGAKGQLAIISGLALKIQTTTRTGVGLRLKVLIHLAFCVVLRRWCVEVQMWTVAGNDCERAIPAAGGGSGSFMDFTHK